MKKTGLVVTSMLLFIVSAMYTYEHFAEKRPGIDVHEIRTTPENYINDHLEIMMPLESVINREYRENGSNKWKTPYKYVYIIRKSSSWFSRKTYLKFHPEDAVDTRLIFSDNKPDPQLFIILK